jgi:hypothetical protein
VNPTAAATTTTIANQCKNPAIEGSHDKKQLMISFAHSVIPQNSIRSHGL